MLQKSRVKQLLKEGKVVYGTFVKSTDPAVIEILGHIGFDFAIIDNEHIGMSKQTLTALIRAAQLAGIEPIVRVRSKDTQEILQTLDAGAQGIQVPNVDTLDDMRGVSDAVYFAPKGKRGFATTSRAAQYGLTNIDSYVKEVEDQVMIITHCETVESVKTLEQQISLHAHDAFFIGPMDMSQSVGVIGHPEDPKVEKVITEAIETCRKHKVPFGTVVGSKEALQKYIDLGMQYAVLKSDFGFLADGAKRMLEQIKK